MSTISEIHLIGLLGDRPAADPTNEGYYYTSTDVDGGTTHRSNGSTWEPIAAGSGSGITDHGALSGLADNDHPQYTTDAEATTLAQAEVATHAAAGDPHTGYQRESEKGAANGYAPLGADGLVPAANLPPSSGSSSQATYLVSGGQVTWIEDLDFQVAAGSGYINGVLRAWAAGIVTLDAADPTNPRIDVIYVDDALAKDSITGTASADPSEPVADPVTQLRLALVTVAATATEPTVTTELLYEENAGSPGEWDWTTSGSGWTLNSTNNPRSGTTDIEGTTVAQNAYIQGERGSGTIDPTDFQQLVFFLRFKAAWGANRFLQVTLRNNGVQVGNALRVSNGFFGLDQTNTTTYQAVIIPTLQFAAAPGSLIDQVRIQAIGTGGTAIGCYIDDIYFTSGGLVSVGSGGLSQDEADARYQQLSEKNAANGYAGLDSGSKVAAANLPDLDSLMPPSASVSMNSQKITSLADPTAAQDAATKAYSDNNRLAKTARVATTATLTLATGVENGDTIDGVTLATGDRVLVKDQSTASENGIYTVNASGAPTRATDFDAQSEVLGSIVLVQEGTANADTLWILTNNATITIGSSNLSFSQLTTGGSGIPATILDAKGDLIAASAADTAARLAVGTSGQILAADSGEATGLKWVTPAAGVTSIGVLAKHSADLSVLNNTHTPAAFDTEVYDTHGFHFTSAANLTGTVAKSSGSATLTGTGTAFTTELSVGQVIQVPGTAVETKVVIAIASNTSLTVGSNFANTASGQTANRTNSYFTIPTTAGAGKYRMTFAGYWAASATGDREFNLYVNTDVVRIVTHKSSTVPMGMELTRVYELAVWDLIHVEVWQNSGATRLFAGNVTYSPEFSIEKVG